MKRNAIAVWNGTIKEGNGHLSTDSTVLNQTQYSFASRFAEGVGTNAEELMAAAHAGCFTMKLSGDLTAAGYTPTVLETKSTITLDTSTGTITTSNLVVKASIPGITDAEFQEIAAGSKQNCPVSKAYKLDITLEASLI